MKKNSVCRFSSMFHNMGLDIMLQSNFQVSIENMIFVFKIFCPKCKTLLL